MNNTISSIGNLQEVEQLEDVNKLVLRVIFDNAKTPPNILSGLAENNLSILDAYWSKNDAEIDEIDFT